MSIRWKPTTAVYHKDRRHNKNGQEPLREFVNSFTNSASALCDTYSVLIRDSGDLEARKKKGKRAFRLPTSFGGFAVDLRPFSDQELPVHKCPCQASIQCARIDDV